jgi:hypothetical protein
MTPILIRALQIWKGREYRSVMLPALGGTTCKELAYAIEDAIREEREKAAKLIEGSQIFHCWGDAEINGLDVQRRLAAAIRSTDTRG